jgi:hypothetical protein
MLDLKQAESSGLNAPFIFSTCYEPKKTQKTCMIYFDKMEL